jgi:hypothetical protein
VVLLGRLPVGVALSLVVAEGGKLDSGGSVQRPKFSRGLFQKIRNMGEAGYRSF